MDNMDLNIVHNNIWNLLLEGVKKSNSPFHYAGICTINNEGFPTSRTIVVRDINKTKKTLCFNTDIRSSKWKELKNTSTKVSLLLYNNILKTQIRISGKSILHYQDADWETAWRNTTDNSRECYASPYSPSIIIKQPNKIDQKFIEIKNTDLDIYKANFGRVEIKIHCIDWLYLKHTGHRRAKFEYKNNKCNMSWLAP